MKGVFRGWPDPVTVIRADLAGLSAPVLSVIVDTEEEFDWHGPFSRRNADTRSLPALPAAQTIFERYGIVPTYVIDYPVATSPAAVDILGPWAAGGRAAIGAHLHPWVTPPFEEVVCPYHSYPCNLGKELEFRKLTVLTRAIAEAFGMAPKVYKAGRYGYRLDHEDLLVRLDYAVDASIMPFRSYAGRGGGPNFIHYPNQPFWTSRDRRILHVPTVHAPIGALRRLAETQLGRCVFDGLGQRLRIPGLLVRLGLVELLTLSPEGNSEENLIRLVNTLAGDGHTIFTLTFHSTSLAPGNTPYTRNSVEVEALLARIDRFLDAFMGTMGGEARSHLELSGLLRSPAGGL